MEWGKAPSVSPESRSTDGGAHSHKPILTLSRVSNNIHVGEVCRESDPCRFPQPQDNQLLPFYYISALYCLKKLAFPRPHAQKKDNTK